MGRTITARIERLRAAGRGEGQPLTQREAHALAGEWYLWFVAKHEEQPGTAENWDLTMEQLEAAYLRFSSGTWDHRDESDDWNTPVVRRHVRATVAEVAHVPTFLAEQSRTLTPEAYDLFLDTVEEEYVAALALLRRRAAGDYSKDKRPLRFPQVTEQQRHGKVGLGCWGLFEAWVRERKPAPSTVNRWRSVFLVLDEEFKGRAIASLTVHEAIRWKGTLVTEERSAVVANDIWLRAARTVFGWALVNKMIAVNPFDGVSIAAPAKSVELREREFREEEWRTILNASLVPAPPGMSRHNALARRWVPWLCAYTGSRPGEITQLRAQDIQRENGVWVVRITPEAGAVKGRRARVVPLHEHLVEQGFVNFTQARGTGPLSTIRLADGRTLWTH